jgi:uncharacterized membrane protein YfcA
VPILIYVAGVPAQQAVGMSLVLVGVTSLLAGLVHRHAGRVDLRAAAGFGLAGVLGAPLGAQLTPRVSPALLLTLFAVLMLMVGTLMLRGLGEPGAPAQRRPAALVLAAGWGVGLLTGFLGVGGGFLVVPALALLVRLPMPVAVGTSLPVIALNCAAGFAGHLGHGLPPLGLTAGFTSVAVIGSLLGARLSGRLSASRLRRAFAVLVLLLALLLLAHNLPEVLA